MKRYIILIITIVCMAIVIFTYNLSRFNQNQYDIKRFNKQFLEYNRKNLYGTDITTVINKAVNNNEHYKIKKDSKGLYISDKEYSTKIYINLEEEGSTYPMESFNKVGLKEFTSYFGELNFKCTRINYHKNGRISEMFFQATNY